MFPFDIETNINTAKIRLILERFQFTVRNILYIINYIKKIYGKTTRNNGYHKHLACYSRLMKWSNDVWYNPLGFMLHRLSYKAHFSFFQSVCIINKVNKWTSHKKAEVYRYRLNAYCFVEHFFCLNSPIDNYEMVA